MNITIRKNTPPTDPPKVKAPPSKSDAHRLLILAALSMGSPPIPITLTDTNADIDATAACLCALGAQLARTSDNILVTPIPRHTPDTAEKECTLDVGESGSTLRFLLPIIGALGKTAVIRMHGRLPDRPLAPLDTLLTAHGMTLQRDPNDRTLLHISGNLTPGHYEIDGSVSSQFVTGLLLALPLLFAPSVLRITGKIASAPYITLTLSAMKHFGILPKESENGHRYDIQPSVPTPLSALAVEGDWSGAAFLLCAGAMQNGVTVTDLSRDSVQGDRRILDILSQTGCSITWNHAGDTVTVLPPGKHPLRPFTVNADDIPDLVPPIAALACACQGTTVISGCHRLKIKESDRLAAVVSMLRALGGHAASDGDTLTVDGAGALSGGMTEGCNDHRMVMSAALCALISKAPVTVTSRDAINKSYPGFFDDFRAFGAAYV